MEEPKRKLMASFTLKPKIKEFISYLHEHDIADKAFVLSNNKHHKILLVTYNIKNDTNMNNLKEIGVLNTLSIQRNKDTNTLYSINALNYILEEESMKTEVPRQNIVIDWNKYSNCFITTSDNKVNIIKTKLLKMVRFTPNFDIDKVRI